MNYFKTIDDDTVATSQKSEWRMRHAVRAVISDDDGRIALSYIGKYDIYKLPGGGVEPNEDLLKSLRREIKEETGCKVDNIKELGETLEVRAGWHLVQISHCFIAHVTSKGELDLTKEEIAEQFELKWASDINEAMSLIQGATDQNYDNQYIKQRDSSILEYYLKKTFIKNEKHKPRSTNRICYQISNQGSR